MVPKIIKNQAKKSGFFLKQTWVEIFFCTSDGNQSTRDCKFLHKYKKKIKNFAQLMYEENWRITR